MGSEPKLATRTSIESSLPVARAFPAKGIQLKLELARPAWPGPGVISNAHPFKSQQFRNHRSFLLVGTRQEQTKVLS